MGKKKKKKEIKKKGEKKEKGKRKKKKKTDFEQRVKSLIFSVKSGTVGWLWLEREKKGELDFQGDRVVDCCE